MGRILRGTKENPLRMTQGRKCATSALLLNGKPRSIECHLARALRVTGELRDDNHQSRSTPLKETLSRRMGLPITMLVLRPFLEARNLTFGPVVDFLCHCSPSEAIPVR